MTSAARTSGRCRIAWSSPGTVRYVAPGTVAATAAAPARIHSGLSPPSSTSVGTDTRARPGSAATQPSAASYGSVCATCCMKPNSGLPAMPSTASAGTPTPSVRNRTVASAGGSVASRSARSVPAGARPDTMYGGSYATTRRAGSPLAAASSTSWAPDEWPTSTASPPAAATTAARSAISASTAASPPGQGPSGPLSPRPRRS